MSVLLDTHVWIWWLSGQSDLPRRERIALDKIAQKDPPRLSAISLWEAQMLYSKGKLALDLPLETWLHEASSPDIVQIVPIDVSVIIHVNQLPARFHGDPADRIITATALANGLPLATHDKQIRRSRIIRLWKPG